LPDEQIDAPQTTVDPNTVGEIIDVEPTIHDENVLTPATV
jgi:hypothetical protein